MLATAAALTNRGHQVTILSQPCVKNRAIALGCDFLSFSNTDDYRRDVALEEQLDRTIPVLVEASVGNDLVNAAHNTEADVVVVDPNLSGAIAAAETLDVPSAVLLHSLFRTFVDLWFGELWSLLAEPINATRRSFKVDEAASWAETLARHDLIISPVPEQFDANTDEDAGVLHHVGFLVPSMPAELIELAAGDNPVVAVSFSTTYQGQHQIIAETLAALAGEDLRVIATTSGYAPGLDAPANAVVADFVPHASLFRHADLVITHGGLGTVAAALQSGVPLLCIPMGRDQALNASRVAAVGAGLTHSSEAGSEGIRHATHAILSDPNYQAAARQIGAASRSAGEAQAAATALEELLG